MPTSTARYITLLFGALIAGLLLVAAFNLSVDPYWLIESRHPPAENTLIDNKSRLVKPAQLLFRKPRTILLGSSTVYRGLNPDDLDASLDAYNFGISALRIDEAATYGKFAMESTPVQTLVIGLDYLMFDAKNRSHAGYDPAINGQGGKFRTLGATMFTWDATLDSLAAMLGRIPKNGDGKWLTNGFKQSAPRGEQELREIIVRTRASYAEHAFHEGGFESFDALLAAAQARRVKLILFFTPVHQSYLDIISETGSMPSFERWKARLAEIARQRGFTIHDLGQENPYARTPLQVSSEAYVDATHYTPAMGRWIFSKLGLPLAKVTDVAQPN